MQEKSDFELISEFKNGNQEAFNLLVRKYQKKVYWIARKMLGNHDDADDVVQDVFVKIFKSLKDFRNESSFYTWVYRITVNFSISFLRRKKMFDLIKFDEAFPATLKVNTNDNPILSIENQEMNTIIEQAIAQLPNKQKKVFILRYYNELPYEEISKILKTSVGGLKANYFHALKNIKKYLDKEL